MLLKSGSHKEEKRCDKIETQKMSQNLPFGYIF